MLLALDAAREEAAEIAIVTTFSAGVCAASTKPGAARALCAFLASAETAEVKRRHGMEPA